jgi:hypothetical protein
MALLVESHHRERGPEPSPAREPDNDPAAERDFYRRLLDPSEAAEPEPLRDQALATIVVASGAQAAYLELRGLEDGEGVPAIWRAATAASWSTPPRSSASTSAARE